MAGKNENREWGSYNTYSKENNELMVAEFWFTPKLNFREGGGGGAKGCHKLAQVQSGSTF